MANGKKSRVGMGMKPRGVPEETQPEVQAVEITEDRPTTEGQPEGALEAVSEGVSGDEKGINLEPEKLQNLESSEGVIVAHPDVADEIVPRSKPAGERLIEELMEPAAEKPQEAVDLEKLMGESAGQPEPDKGEEEPPEDDKDKEPEEVDPRTFLISGVGSPSSADLDAVMEQAGYAARIDSLKAPQNELGPQPNGSHKWAVTVEEGYVSAVEDWAREAGITPEKWLSDLVHQNVETYAVPAKGR
jgi:hypothetical protein